MIGHLVLVETGPPFASINLLPMDRAYVLGRSTRCDIVVNHSTVSRRHAEISPADSSVRIVDLRSLNGTFIDNEQVEQSDAMIGQHLRFGSVSFILAASALEADSFDSSVETSSVVGNKKRTVPSTLMNLAARQLSPAQLRVFQLLLAGLMEKVIAKRLSISPHTVHNHIRAIYAAFGVHSRSQLLATELQNTQAFRLLSAKVTEKGIDTSELEKGGEEL